MNTENTREVWDSALQLPTDKMPLQNLDIDPENLKYYLTHEEYNILLKAVQSLIREYTEGPGSIIDPENPNNTYTILKRGDTREATDNNLFTALRVLDELRDLEDRLINGDPDDPNGVGLGDRFLSKVTHDKAAGIITFLQGIKFQPTQEDANLNTGGAIKSFGINQYGIGHLRGLNLDEWLEVPELRFNRVEVNVGDFWRAPGGGKIESVEIDSADTGIITLKVEEGEMGAISENDLCLGIYHFLGNGEEPAPENSEVDIDDGKGNRAIKGFASIYFTITEILTETLVDGEMVPVPANTKFRYKLRPTNSTTFFTQHHPQPFMNFVVYGNSDDNKKHRQNSSYQTKRYERFLVNVNDWEYGDANIAAQFGDLSNISHIVGEHEGYSVYLSNVYFSGNLQQLESTTITPVLSNPNVPIKVDEEGVKNLDNTSTNLQVYEGSQELKYLPGSSVDLTEGTYSVTIDTIAIDHGTITDSGTYLQMGVASNMRRDSATIIFKITGKRVNGKNFETAIHQNFYVIDFGADGQDGTQTKWIYTRTKEHLTPDIPTDANLSVGAFPQWTEDPVGPDHEYRYEWVSKKESYSEGVWTNYSYPSLWSNYAYDGSDGKDGKSVEFVYNRSNDTAIPPELIDVEDRTLDENLPGGVSALGETWSDNPRGVDPTHSVEWVSKRVKVGVLQEDREEGEPEYLYLWGDYSEPTIWAKYSFDGKPGEKGSGIQIKGSFDSWTKLSTVVEPELGDGYLVSGDLWIYDGVTPAVEGTNPFGWTNVGQISGESAYFHIAYADSVVFLGETPISINGFSSNDYAHKAWLGTYADHNEMSASEEEWFKYKWTHIKGNDGPGQEFIYKLMDREPASDEPIPVKAVDDNSDDNIPTGWTDNPKGCSPSDPYEWVSIRKKRDGIWGPYTRPVVWTNYAKPGDPGAPGIAGPEGPGIVFRGTYNVTQTYYGTALRRDVVVHNGTYYITRKSLNGSFTNKPVSDANYWESFGANFDSVATDLLLAEEANIAGFSYLGQKMVSQNGYVGSTPSTNPSDSGFIPNLSLDGITGTIHARQGSIGGFELTKNYLQSTETGTSGNKNLILNGTTGQLTANDATIKGHIDAISGTFAGELIAATGTFNGKVTSAAAGKKIIIDPVTSSLKFEDESEIVRATMGFDDSDTNNKHTYLSLKNVDSPQVRHNALLKPGYQLLKSDYYGGSGAVTTILLDCFNSVLQINEDGRYGASGYVKATASSDSGGFLAIRKVEASTGLITKTEISPTNLKITDSSSNTCEIKVDGMYINGTKFTGEGAGYVLPIATSTTLGGIKVGSRLTISSGVLSANVQSDNNFTNAYKNKLDGIATGANNYTHPSSHPISFISGLQSALDGKSNIGHTHSYLPLSGGTMTGVLKAQNNTSYTTKQVRNIILSTGNAVAAQMENGDIWIKYE